MNIFVHTEGQLISEGNFAVFKSPKKWTFLYASKMSWINKIDAFYFILLDYE